MCMSKVYLTRIKKNNYYQIASKEGVFRGYKSFKVSKDGVLDRGCFWVVEKPKIGKWYSASNEVVNDLYTSGFHIFLDKRDAHSYRIIDGKVYLVEFSDIVAIGKQSSSNKDLTVVAKKMRILKEIT
jgi:hypothetical protein